MVKECFEGYWYNQKGQPISFNLYGHEDIDFETTKTNIFNEFKNNHLKKLKVLFLKYGLKLHNLNYYSPNAYNFQGDSIDLIISISDKKKLINYIKKQSKQITQMLDNNKSYDGYISTTEYNINEILDNINKNKVSVMVISSITKKYLIDEYKDFYDLFIYEENDNDE
jgi:hypothetical protein